MTRLLILILFLPINVLACSCGIWKPLTVKDYNESEFIISGKAIKVTADTNEIEGKQRQIEFQIDEVFKGRIDLKTITIYTSLSDASCGLFVKENEEWIIWAYLRDNVISTSLCTRSMQKKYSSEYELKSLNYFKSNPSTSEWRNESGILIAVGRLEKSIPVGHWKYLYNNGNVESEGTYKNGKYDGKWIIYNEPEIKIKQLQHDKHIPEDSIPDIRLFENRILEIQNYKNGLRDGKFIRYAFRSLSYIPRIISDYKNGELDGKYISYYDNGLISYVQNYKEGKLEGYERLYYPNGQLKQEGKFAQSKPTGEFKLYSEAGELIMTTVDKRPSDK